MRVVAPTVLASGGPIRRGPRMIECAADVLALADRLGAARFAVSGFPRAAPTLAVAAAYPERVTAALLMSSAGDPSTRPGPGRGAPEQLLSRMAQPPPAAAGRCGAAPGRSCATVPGS